MLFLERGTVAKLAFAGRPSDRERRQQIYLNLTADNFAIRAERLVAVSAGTAIATTATTETAAGTAIAFSFWSGFVDCQLAAAKVSAIEHFNSFGCFVIG